MTSGGSHKWDTQLSQDSLSLSSLCLIPSSPCFTLLFFSSPNSPPPGTYIAVYHSFHGFFILLQHVAIQTPLNFEAAPSLYKIRILLYSTSCTSPRKTRLHLLPPVQTQVLGSAPSPWDSDRGWHIPLPGQEGLAPTPLVPRSCFCTSLFLSTWERQALLT